MAQMVKNPPAMWETGVQSLGQEYPLEKGKATHSSVLAWRIPWTEEPAGLQSMGCKRVGPDLVTNFTAEPGESGVYQIPLVPAVHTGEPDLQPGGHTSSHPAPRCPKRGTGGQSHYPKEPGAWVHSESCVTL